MLKINLKKFSYQFAENVLNSKLELKQEIEDVLANFEYKIDLLSRREFNKCLQKAFREREWKSNVRIVEKKESPHLKINLLKERIGLRIAFIHSHFIGHDLLSFQIASAIAYDIMDVGVYIVTTKDFQQFLLKKYGIDWTGSITFEQVTDYLNYVKTTIRVPIYLIGIDI